MFSLIITIISIALVAALALATLYYGGGAFSKGSAKADAAKILLQGQQLLGASELFQAGENRWPDNMLELRNSKYLTSVPQAKASVQSAIELATAASTEWTMPKDKAPMFLLSNIASLDVCGFVNLQGSLKNKGVLAKAYPGLAIQCYGPAAGLQVIIKKSTEADSLISDPPGVDLQGIDPGAVGEALPPSVVGCIADPGSCPGRAVDDPTVWTQPPGVPSTGPTEPGGTGGETGTGGALTPPKDGFFTISTQSFAMPSTMVGSYEWAVPLPILTNRTPHPISLDSFTLQDPDTVFYAYLGDGLNPSWYTSWPSYAPVLYPSTAGALAGTEISLCGKALNPGTACLLYADFNPLAPGLKTAAAVLATTEGPAPGVPKTYNFSARGTGIPYTAIPRAIYRNARNLPISNYSFPGTWVGQTSEPVAFGVLNAGDADLVFTEAGVTVPAPFKLVSSTCSGTLTVNAMCWITVTFGPTAQGPQTGSLGLVSSTPGLAGLQLSGLIDSPLTLGRLTVSTSIFKFPDTAPGGYAWAAPMPLLTNTGQGDVQLTSITASNSNRFWPWISTESGSFPTWYAGPTTGPALCKAALPAGASCQLYAEFYPRAGLSQATAALTTSEGVINFTMSGRGVVFPRVSSSTVDFGAMNENQVLLIENTSTGLLKVTNVSDSPFTVTSITSSNPSAFPGGLGTCMGALPPGSTQGCFPSIAFTPTSTGLFSSIVTISTTAGDVSVSVVGQGLGTPLPLRTLTLHRGLNTGVVWGDRMYDSINFRLEELLISPSFLTAAPGLYPFPGIYPQEWYMTAGRVHSGACGYIGSYGYEEAFNAEHFISILSSADWGFPLNVNKMAFNDTCYVRPNVPLGTKYVMNVHGGREFVKVIIVRGPGEPANTPLYQGGKVSYMNPVSPANGYAHPGEYALNCPAGDATVRNACQASRIRDTVLEVGNPSVQCSVVNSAGPSPYFESYEIICNP